MSAAIKTKQPRKFSVSAPALWVVLGLAIALFLIRYGQEVLMEHDLGGKIVIQSKLNSQMEDENNRLQALLEYYKSDKYIEQRAREDLNLRRADEEVLIPIGGNSTGQAQGGQPANADNQLAEATATGENDANWQKWFDLFSPFASGSGSP